jgi:superfamily II DNA or RNA helicase
VDIRELEKLFKDKTGLEDTTIWEQMMLLSREMEATPGSTYKHDGYQATIAAILVALAKKCTICALPTSSGKTYVSILVVQYNKKYTKKIVIVVVPTPELKVQMEN